jgi:hypothetical protein
MPKLYRESGFESIAQTASIASSGVVISAPGAGYSIYIIGVSALEDSRFTETNAGGNQIVVANAGMADFPATIKVKENTAVYAFTTGLTVFYYIDVV